MEITKIFLTKHYEINDKGKVPIKIARKGRTAVQLNTKDIRTRGM